MRTQVRSECGGGIAGRRRLRESGRAGERYTTSTTAKSLGQPLHPDANLLHLLPPILHAQCMPPTQTVIKFVQARGLPYRCMLRITFLTWPIRCELVYPEHSWVRFRLKSTTDRFRQGQSHASRRRGSVGWAFCARL